MKPVKNKAPALVQLFKKIGNGTEKPRQPAVVR